MNKAVYKLCIKSMHRWRRMLGAGPKIDQIDFMHGFKSGYSAGLRKGREYPQANRLLLKTVAALKARISQLAIPNVAPDIWKLNNPHPGSAFIQWKNTDVCMDLHCPKCEHHNHYDADFCYFVQCAKCRTVFEMNCFVAFRPATDLSSYSAQHPKQSELYEWTK